MSTVEVDIVMFLERQAVHIRLEMTSLLQP